MESVLTLIANNGFICVNKNIIRKLGLNCAVLLGELASEYNYWAEHNKLTEDGYFYMTAELCEYNTGLSYYEQSKAIEDLKKYNILSTKNQGMPAKKYFKLDTLALMKLLNTEVLRVEEQDFKNSNTSFQNFEANNNNIINNNINLDDKSSKEITDFLAAKNNKKEIFKATEDKSVKKEKDPDNTKAYKNLVEFISNLRYNQTTIDNLLLWYKSVGVGKVSIKQLKDKIIKLHEAKLTEVQISESFYNAYMNGWFAFYVPSYNTSKYNKKSNDIMYQESVKTADDDYIRNEDGSLKVY